MHIDILTPRTFFTRHARAAVSHVRRIQFLVWALPPFYARFFLFSSQCTALLNYLQYLSFAAVYLEAHIRHILFSTGVALYCRYLTFTPIVERASPDHASRSRTSTSAVRCPIRVGPVYTTSKGVKEVTEPWPWQ